MIRFFSVVIIIALLLSGCILDFNSGDNHETSYVESDVLNVADTYFPDFETVDKSDNTEYYENVTTDMLDEYIKFLCADGFECKRDMYNVLLYKEDVMIQITDNTKIYDKCNVTVYTAIRTENNSALTETEALSIIDDEKVFFLLEQTPDGFFESTGAQYYFTPVHSFSYLTYKETHIPENSYYYTSKCLVADKGVAFVNNAMSAPIVCDINDDDVTDIIFLGYGPTSGLFTISLDMYNIIDGKPVLNSSNIYNIEHGEIDICANSSGKPVLTCAPNGTDNHMEYEVVYKNNELTVEDDFFHDWDFN